MSALSPSIRKRNLIGRMRNKQSSQLHFAVISTEAVGANASMVFRTGTPMASIIPSVQLQPAIVWSSVRGIAGPFGTPGPGDNPFGICTNLVEEFHSAVL